MSDALSPVLPFEYPRNEGIADVASQEGRRRHWLWLTKRPDRMAKFPEFLRGKKIARPENLWAGTIITTQATTTRIKSRLKIGGEDTTRFLPVERSTSRSTSRRGCRSSTG